MTELLQQATGRPAADFATVTNGYDAALVQAAQADPLPHDKLVLLHAGHFYGPRSPEPLLRTRRASRADPQFANRLELRLLGRPNETIARLAAELGITDIVNQVGLISYKDTLRHLLASDLALVVQPGTDLQIPAKLYDYLGCRVPVIALTIEGATARLMRETNAGPLVAPNNVEAIATALRNALSDRRIPARSERRRNGERTKFSPSSRDRPASWTQSPKPWHTRPACAHSPSSCGRSWPPEPALSLPKGPRGDTSVLSSPLPTALVESARPALRSLGEFPSRFAPARREKSTKMSTAVGNKVVICKGVWPVRRRDSGPGAQRAHA